MAINKKDHDRLSRFQWSMADIVIIKPGDEELPKSDTERDKPGSGDDEAPDAAEKDPPAQAGPPGQRHTTKRARNKRYVIPKVYS